MKRYELSVTEMDARRIGKEMTKIQPKWNGSKLNLLKLRGRDETVQSFSCQNGKHDETKFEPRNSCLEYLYVPDNRSLRECMYITLAYHGFSVRIVMFTVCQWRLRRLKMSIVSTSLFFTRLLFDSGVKNSIMIRLFRSKASIDPRVFMLYTGHISARVGTAGKFIRPA